MALWSGRFEEGVSEFTQEYGASLPVDKAMYKQDIAGSKAHATMLAAQGVISREDAQAICEGLDNIERTIDAGEFTVFSAFPPNPWAYMRNLTALASTGANSLKTVCCGEYVTSSKWKSWAAAVSAIVTSAVNRMSFFILSVV